MGLLDTAPSVLALATSEEVVYGWDTTNYVNSTGDTAITNPSVILTDVSVRPAAVVPLPDSPTINGINVLQRFRGTSVIPGHYYVAYVTFTGAQSGNVMTMRTQVNCPF
jgi:hypothetical protein